jgi:hypothetical protein
VAQEKDEFCYWVVLVIKEHPDWLQDLLWSVQQGITLRLQEERTRSSNLATGLGWLLTKAPKIVHKEKEMLRTSLIALKYMYSGAGIEKEIDKLLEEEE